MNHPAPRPDPVSPGSPLPAPPKVFLTGASAGIGLAVARRLTGEGAEVWGTSRDVSRLPVALARFHPVALDLNDPMALADRFAQAQAEAGGRFDVLINNAGDGWFGPALNAPAEILHRQFQTLVFAPITLIQLAVPAMRAPGSPGGLVVNVTSLAARLPLVYGAPYSAAKAALSAFTGALRMEEPEAGGRVRYVDLQPGDIRTDFNRSMAKIAGLNDADPAQASGSGAVASTTLAGRGAVPVVSRRAGQPALLPTVRASVQRVLASSDRDIEQGPPPEVVAERIHRLVFGKEDPGLVTVGTFEQARLGPIGYRLLPAAWMHRLIRGHFGLH